MNAEEYIKVRVDNQIGWYDQKSQQAQQMFKRLSVFEIIAAAAIPVLVGFGEEVLPVALIVAVLGALIAIASALIGLNQYQKNWTEYRTTCESLKHEKFLYLTKADPYQGEDADQLLVKRVESLISKENSAWAQLANQQIEKPSPQ